MNTNKIEQNETLAEAVRRLTAQIEQQPNNAELYIERGKAYFDHQNWYNAEDDFSKAIELAPANAKYIAQRAVNYCRLDDYEKAITDFLRTVELEGNNYDFWTCLGNAYAETGDHFNAIRAFEKAKELNKRWAVPFYACGKSWIQMWQYDDGKEANLNRAIENFDLAIDILKEKGENSADCYALKTISFNSLNLAACYAHKALVYDYLNDFENVLTNYYLAEQAAETETEKNEYHKHYCLSAEKQQKDQPLEERIAPYQQKINLLKENAAMAVSEVVTTEQDRICLFATIVLLEEYKLIERFLKECGSHYLNKTLPASFAYWEPTTLYFITAKKQRVLMSNVCKMIHYLVVKGANPNIPAGDGSTPLWNLTISGDVEILKTLLECGADPNQSSIDNESIIYPLQNCLLPTHDKEDENTLLPYDISDIERAKILIAHGANPSLCGDGLEDYPPLNLAIIYGPKTKENAELIQILAEKSDKSSLDKLEISGINFTIFTDILRGASKGPFTNKKYFSKSDFASEEMLEVEGYNIIFSEQTSHVLKGKILYDNYVACGNFSLDCFNQSYSTGHINICYDVEADLEIEIDFNIKTDSARISDCNAEDPVLSSFDEPMRHLLANAKKFTIFPPASCEANIARCNAELKQAGFPELPNDYVNFLLKMDGFAFNSVEFWGDAIIQFPDEDFVLSDILSENEMMRTVYGKQFKNCLIIGRDDMDYYIFNAETKKYEIHSHECYDDIWDEWDSFEEVFINNAGAYLGNDNNDDDSRYDAWA